MNFRVLTLKYLGWCPGVRSAARFVPDRNIPPKRIALMFVLAASVSVSCFSVSQRVLNAAVFPSTSIVRVTNGDPALTTSEDSIYIAMNVETTISGSPGTGRKYHRSRIYVAKLCLDGTLEDEVEAIDLGDAVNVDMDLLVTRDGRWLLAYVYDTFSGNHHFQSHLYVISSVDGRLWEEPTVVAESVGKSYPDMPDAERRKMITPDKPSLMEAGHGEVFISFNVNYDLISYSILTQENGWSSPAEIPLVADEQSCFLDEDGRITVVGADIYWPEEDWYDENVKGISYAVMEKDGTWADPRCLTHLSLPIRGLWPRMFYSDRHGGYFLTLRDPEHPNKKVLTVYFTPDLELESWSWNRPTTFMDMWEGYLAELSDGTLVLVFSRARSLFISTSGDGDSWTTPTKVEQIRDEEALVEALSRERTFLAGIISLAVTALVVIVAFKRPSLSFGAPRNGKSGLGTTP